jgi:osmotically-inducible protein OsmY
MNRSRARGGWIAVVAVTVLLGACQGYRDGSMRTVGEYTDDMGVQSRVKMALLNDPDIKGLSVDTSVNRGVVTLTGDVKSEAQRARAVQVTAQVRGVTRVEDALTVVTE